MAGMQKRSESMGWLTSQVRSRSLLPRQSVGMFCRLWMIGRVVMSDLGVAAQRSIVRVMPVLTEWNMVPECEAMMKLMCFFHEKSRAPWRGHGLIYEWLGCLDSSSVYCEAVLQRRASRRCGHLEYRVPGG